MELVKNCFNYVGSKDRIMRNVLENLDTSKEMFVDLFCGSGTVGVNVANNTDYKLIVMNDACWQVIEILKKFKELGTPENILTEIDAYINKYKLDKDNKEGYLEARELYKEEVRMGKFNPILLYVLITHAFNYNIVFNSKEEFNVPSGAGRCWFNPALRKKLISFTTSFNKIENIQFTTCKITPRFVEDNFDGLADKEAFSNVMVYADPPYYCSDASHSRIYGLNWGIEEEATLYEYLDKVHEYGGSFLLSNLVVNNGHVNTILEKWMSKYNVVDVDVDYSGCCYQKNKKVGETREVLIKNY